MQYSAVLDPLTAAAGLRSRGEPFVMATVVRAVAPTSAKPGDKAVFTDAGLLVGWIGGSCAEPIIRETAQTALADGQSRLVLITPNQSAVTGEDGMGRSVHRMTCYSGGELEIYVEPMLALPRLLVFGNSPVARALCQLGAVMRYEVTAIDLGDRPQMGEDIATVRSLQALPRVDAANAYAVVSSHGVFDEESLEAALALELPYTGFVTSKKRREQVFAALRERGASEAALARVLAPAGLELGAEQPEEIALSVMAQIVALRRHSAIAQWPQAVKAASANSALSTAAAQSDATLRDSAGQPPPTDVQPTHVNLTLRKASGCCHASTKP